MNEYIGYLNKQAQTMPYFVYNTGDILDGFGNIQSKIRSYGQNLINRNSSSVIDNSFVLKMPGVWQDKSDIAIVADTGFVVATDKLGGGQVRIDGSDIFRVNIYTKVPSPNQYALYFHLKNDDRDVGTSYTVINYANGSMLELSFSDNSCKSAWFFSNYGVVYFAFNASYKAKLGFFETGTTVFNLIGELEPNRLYMLTSAPSIASGVVTDKLKNPVPNCKIAAFRRDNFSLVGHAMSNGQGEYKMPIAVLKGETVFMVCLDNDTAPDFEAIIYDRIQVV